MAAPFLRCTLNSSLSNRGSAFFQGSYHLKPDDRLPIDGHDAKGAAIQMILTRIKNAG